MRKALIGTAVILALASLASGCSEAPAAPATEPASAPVAEVIVREVELASIHAGRVEAAQRVELRPRVAGVIQEVLFREGEKVTPGQPLFRIDPRPFDAALQKAQADVAAAEVRAQLARTEAARADRLAQENAISTEGRERRRAVLLEAEAALEAARAAAAAARLDREFSELRAPISGRAGRANVTAGNYVGAGLQQGPLTTIVSTDALHVYFEVADGVVASRLIEARRAPAGGLAKWKARIELPDGSGQLDAPINFADNEVATGTGTLKLRARVDGASALLPGMFVRVHLTTGAPREAVLIDEKAVGVDQGRRYVLAARADNVLEYRAVTLGPKSGGLRVVASGLERGDRIVVSGLMRLRPGVPVKPRPVAMGADPGVGGQAVSPRPGSAS